MTYPIVDLTFWSPGDPRTEAIDALLADPGTPLAKHGLTGIAEVYAEETGAPLHDLHLEWADHINRKTLAVDGALTEVVPALDAAGIPYFIAKGPAIAYFDYPDPRMRPYTDLDVYVTDDVVAEARAVLAVYGYEPVPHVRGQLDGLGRELHGGRFGAVVEVHGQPIDNLHRKSVPPVAHFLQRLNRRVVAGVPTPMPDADGHLEVQAIHLAAGHRYAKLILLRDVASALAAPAVTGRLSAAGRNYVATVVDILRGLGVGGDERPARQRSSLLRRLFVTSHLAVHPHVWDEHALTLSNVLAVANQHDAKSVARAVSTASVGLIPTAGQRARVHARPRVGRDLKQLNIGVFGARGIPSTYGGYETFFTVLLPELVRRGHDVTVYCRKGEVEGTEPFMGVKRHILPAIASKQASTLSHGAIAAVTARLARHDVVLAVNVANAPFCAALRATGTRVVLNTDGQEWMRGKWGPLAKSYFRGAARIAGRSATALIADSSGMADIYEREFNAASTVIPYCWTGLDVASGADPQTFGVAPGQYAIIAGRLVPENNIDAVVDAYTESNLPLPLLVLGSANYDSPVERRIAAAASRDPRIIRGGHVADRGTYGRLVAEAAVYIHAHSVGGINPSLIEAMGVGARVLALDTPFNRQALGDAGEYFDRPSELAPAMVSTLAASSAEDEALRDLARARVGTTFSLVAVADAYEQLLRAGAAAARGEIVSLESKWMQG